MTFNISRYRNIHSEDFGLEVVTPLFLGGADQKESILRSASIKGALRFWWRAINDAEDLKALKNRESEIFGSTEKKSTLSIALQDAEKIPSVSGNLPQGTRFTVKGKNFKPGIIDYLAFGIRDHKNGYIRQHIPSGSVFRISLRFLETHRNDILDAFHFWLAHGGLGAKSRNGFGSLGVVGATPVAPKTTGKMKHFTALSDETKLFEFGVHNRWVDALSEIGLAYRSARLSLEPRHRFDNRLLLAKPIIQSHTGNDRHAKPFFLHISKLSKQKYQGRILLMPYQYYDASKRRQYMDVCEKMGKFLLKVAGGAK